MFLEKKLSKHKHHNHLKSLILKKCSKRELLHQFKKVNHQEGTIFQENTIFQNNTVLQDRTTFQLNNRFNTKENQVQY